MYGWLNVKFIIGCVVCAIAFCAGWYINQNRWEKRDAERIVKLTEVTKKVQDTIHAAYVVERNAKDEEIRSISKRLADALSGLRDRPSRTTSTITGVGKGSTGAELSREDADFLVREAARADEVVADRNACYAVYESARIALGK
jgi:hypothetical protein